MAFILLLLAPAAAQAGDHWRHGGYYRDHGRYYHSYRPGFVVNVVPRGVLIPFGGYRYRYAGGYFYRPRARDFVVVAAPVGIVVPVLPRYYSTVVVRGVSYYHCDDDYYVWSDRDRGYRVVNAPDESASAPEPQATQSDQVYAYPRQGQSSDRESADRYACHAWAVDQTGFDPTQPLGGVSESRALSARDSYQRAFAACLDARGYSVR